MLMSKRKLKRQLNLAQVVMLGTAGTLAAEIFVLTGHAAGMAGPGSCWPCPRRHAELQHRPQLLRAGDHLPGRPAAR